MKVRLLLTAVLGVLAAAAVAVPAQAATQVNYAALGDSYSAGVGAGGYDLSSGICLPTGSTRHPLLSRKPPLGNGPTCSRGAGCEASTAAITSR